jgi:hypothetical protein
VWYLGLGLSLEFVPRIPNNSKPVRFQEKKKQQTGDEFVLYSTN